MDVPQFIDSLLKKIYLAAQGLDCGTKLPFLLQHGGSFIQLQYVGSSSLIRNRTWAPHWEHRDLATGPPQKPPIHFLKDILAASSLEKLSIKVATNSCMQVFV